MPHRRIKPSPNVACCNKNSDVGSRICVCLKFNADLFTFSLKAEPEPRIVKRAEADITAATGTDQEESTDSMAQYESHMDSPRFYVGAQAR